MVEARGVTNHKLKLGAINQEPNALSRASHRLCRRTIQQQGDIHGNGQFRKRERATPWPKRASHTRAREVAHVRKKRRPATYTGERGCRRKRSCERALDFLLTREQKFGAARSLEECVGREQMFDIRAKGGQAITKTHSNDDHGVTAPQPHCHYASLARRAPRNYSRTPPFSLIT